ncbi:MAG: response regulator, partial [Desulfobulbaceae bacterium]|nr:response regulator [Desulfobulbaceae bacterium]
MKKVILIVEDDPKNLKLIRDLLQVKRYSTLEATNGKESVEIAKEKKPCLILMDIQMPVMDGYEATREIRSRSDYADLPIIAMTANVMADDRKKVNMAGMDDHIGKPLNVNQMFITMAKWIATHRDVGSVENAGA